MGSVKKRRTSLERAGFKAAGTGIVRVYAGEIVLMADVRIGELTREMEKAPHARGAGRGFGSVRGSDSPKKAERLAAEGLSKQAASRERLAAMPKADMAAYVKASRAAKKAAE